MSQEAARVRQTLTLRVQYPTILVVIGCRQAPRVPVGADDAPAFRTVESE
jgi:hypothetical protein